MTKNSWIEVSSTSEIPVGSYRTISVGFESILIINQNGRYFALENACSHDGNEFDGGEIENEEFICPRHGAAFCLKTGEVLRGPAEEDIKSFPLQIVDGKVQIQV